MPIEICSIGGFTKTEGNSVAVKVDDEVVILDMGLSMEDYIKYTEDREDVHSKTYKELLRVNAVPDYRHIEDWKSNVKAIVPSHGHLDHVGAIPFAAPLFPTAQVISAPYTIEILRSILRDEHLELPNRLISLAISSKYKLSDKITIELVAITHSIQQTAIVVLHTPYGKVVYANDFKLDRQPVLGKKPDFERLKQLGDEGDVSVLIMNCLYVDDHKRCPSESVAKEMLKDTLLGVDSKHKAIIVTTFSSHLARLKSIIALGKKLNRKIIFLGRSLDKYVHAGENVGIVDFSGDVKIYRKKERIEGILKRVQNDKGKYLVVCTGHQGEPRAILSRIARKELHFKFEDGDVIVFSCKIIPVEINIENRARLEKTLHGYGVRIYTDIHVSGHGAREDHREMIEMLKPKGVMPIHAEPEKAEMLVKLANSLGCKNGYIMEDGKRIRL